MVEVTTLKGVVEIVCSHDVIVNICFVICQSDLYNTEILHYSEADAFNK